MTSSHETRTILDPEEKCLTFINTFMVAPEKAEDLLAALKAATEEVFARQPGFISANLHMSRDRHRIVNYAQWRSKEDYDSMSKNPEIQTHMKACGALMESFDPVDYDLRDVIHGEPKG